MIRFSSLLKTPGVIRHRVAKTARDLASSVKLSGIGRPHPIGFKIKYTIDDQKKNGFDSNGG